jgi:hypothetical protein
VVTAFEGGVIQYLATINSDVEPWSLSEPAKNPHTSGEVVAAMSSIHNSIRSDSNPSRLVMQPHDGRTENGTKNEPDSWVAVDLGKGRSLVPSDYCARHGHSNGYYRLQSWDFEGSNDGSNYTVLRSHKNDNSLPNKGFSVAAWKVEGANQAYRYFRIRQTGANSYGIFGPDHRLRCAGIELYGVLWSGGFEEKARREERQAEQARREERQAEGRRRASRQMQGLPPGMQSRRSLPPPPFGNFVEDWGTAIQGAVREYR